MAGWPTRRSVRGGRRRRGPRREGSVERWNSEEVWGDGLVIHCKSYPSPFFLGPELIIQLHCYIFVARAPWSSSTTFTLGITDGHHRED